MGDNGEWSSQLAAMGAGTNLHDELNGTDEVHEELENHVLLLLLHLVETVLSSSLLDFGRGKTDAGIRLEEVLGDGASAGTSHGLIVLRVLLSFLGLEIVDESIDVLDVIVVLVERSNGLLADCMLLRIGEAALRDVGAEAVGGGCPCWANVRHGEFFLGCFLR